MRLDELGQLNKVFDAFGRGRGGTLGPNEGRTQRELGQLVPEGIQRVKVVLQDIELRSAQKMKELKAPRLLVPLCQSPMRADAAADGVTTTTIYERFIHRDPLLQGVLALVQQDPIAALQSATLWMHSPEPTFSIFAAVPTGTP